MDYLEMTAPCGLPCFNCFFYLANDENNKAALQRLEMYNRLMGLPIEAMKCPGCRSLEGKRVMQKELGLPNTEPCKPYACTKEQGIDFCYECDDFPCDKLHPYADRAEKLPHNTKVFNLCLIRKMGLEKWAKEKSAQVLEVYFNKWWEL